MLNLIRYTLGLPFLLLFTLGIGIFLPFFIILDSALGNWGNTKELWEEIIEMWKPV